jgi:hypothetical protein
MLYDQSEISAAMLDRLTRSGFDLGCERVAVVATWSQLFTCAPTLQF